MKEQKQTQLERVLERIDEVGYVDNFWAFHNYILRLGAIIFDLKAMGYEFEAGYGKGKDKKNYHYKLINK